MFLALFYLSLLSLLSGASSLIHVVLSLEVLSWVFILMLPVKMAFGYLTIQSYFLLTSVMSVLYSVPPLLLLSLLLKTGFPPFYMWVLQVAEGLNSKTFLFMTTIHKFYPVFLLSKSLVSNILLMSAAFMMMLASSLMISFYAVLPVLVLSSMVHSAWAVFGSLVSKGFLLFYWGAYSLVNVALVKMMTLETLGETFLSHSGLSSFFWLVLSGFPPFLVFWLKAHLLFYVIMTTSVVMSSLLALSSLLTLSAYFRAWHLSSFIVISSFKAWTATLLLLSLIGVAFQ